MLNTSTPPSTENVLQACADGDLDGMLAMLPQCADPPQQGEMVLKAIVNGHAAIIRHLLADGLGPYGHRAFAEAAVRSKSPPVMQALVDAGLDINHECGYATMLRHPLSYIKFLLELGADPNFGRAITYYSALHLAVSHDTPDTLFLLLAHGAQVKGSTALLAAAMGGRLEMLKILVEHFPEDINDMPAPDEEWSDGERDTGTALHTAARLAHVEMVKYLLDKGADPGLRDARGRTARELAEAEANIEAGSFIASTLMVRYPFTQHS